MEMTSRRRHVVLVASLLFFVCGGSVVWLAFRKHAHGWKVGYSHVKQSLSTQVVTAGLPRWLQEGNGDKTNEDDRNNFASGPRPSKGSTDCGEWQPDKSFVDSLVGRRNDPRDPCHDTMANRNKAPAPENEDTNLFPSTLNIPENQVDLIVFVGIDPGKPSVAHLVTELLTKDLNETIDNMNFIMGDDFLEGSGGPSEIDEQNGGNVPQGTPDFGDEDAKFPSTMNPVPNREGGNEETSPALNPRPPGEEGEDGDLGDEVGIEIPLKAQSREANLSPPSGLPTGRQILRFNMLYRTYFSKLQSREIQRWWWEYRIRYECYWADDSNPVGEKLMPEIKRNMTMTVNQHRYRLTELLRDMTDDKNLLLRVFPPTPGILDPEETMAPTPVPNLTATPPPDTATLETFPNHLDVREWSWSRYLGFGLFLGTFAGVVITSQVGGLRRRRKLRQQVWGNLASEEGVKELLSTGWILRDDRMEVYDKTRVGYRDDDSMLIGGFEQREPGPGTEIVTPTTAEETSTRGGASTSRGSHTLPPPPPMLPSPPQQRQEV